MTLTSPLYRFNGFSDGKWEYASPNANRSMGRASMCDSGVANLSLNNCPNVAKGIHVPSSSIPETLDMYLYSRKATDLLWHIGECLIREERVPAIAASNFSGVDFRRVNLYRDRKCATPLNGYLEMRAVGRVPLDLERSGVKVKYECPLCGHRRYSTWDDERGLHFSGEYDEWPDVFMPEQAVLTAIFVKTAFAQAIVDLKLDPVILTRVEDMKTLKLPGWP